MIFSPEALKHERRIYAFFDLIGDLGGVLEISTIVFGAFLIPIAEHVFIKAAAKTFFVARTKDDTLFKDMNEGKDEDIPKFLRKDTIPENLSLETRERMNHHRFIRLRTKDHICFFFNDLFGCCNPF